ncbi:protein lin-54 homolog isoform X3 [Ctenocephalides felis]|nr:protein lin-54 homolog isoform X3 [Ctenocephalides felis]
MAHVMLNEVTDMLEDDLQPIEQYDYIALDELQPMEQGLEQYQGEEVQRETMESEENQSEEQLQQQEPEVEEVIVPEIEEKPIIVQTAPTARTIAPKPAVSKLIGGASGQQIVFIQGPNSQTGPTMRLVSSNSASAPTGSFQLVKRSDGVMQLRQAPPKVVTTAIKKIAPAPISKNLLTKVIVKGNNHVLLGSSQASESNAIKLLPLNTSVAGGIKLTSPTKTITLAQAQNMGLIRSNANKLQVVSSTAKVGIKAPMKILPAPSHGITPIKTGINPQNIIIKQTNIRPVAKQTILATKSVGATVQPITMSTSLIKAIKTTTQVPTVKTSTSSQVPQVIKIQSGQNTSSGQIHQINVPGRGIQYVRLVSNTTPTSTSVQPQVQQKTTTFTTRPVLKQALPGIKSMKSTVVSIRPALSGTKTLVTSKPTMVKSVNKYNDTIMTSKPSTMSSATSTSTSAATNIMKQIKENPSKEIKATSQFIPKRRSSEDDNKYQTPMEIDPEDLIEERLPIYGRPIFKYLKQEVKRELSLENLTLIDKRGKDIIEVNGIRPRKPCNCTRSQCLKLYCDCFANGEFCNMCNCKDCMNNIENEDERQKAIRSCLDRNPSAFRPKIGKAKDPGLETIRRHNKGCNCKRSGCLKNYCECFEAKIACSNNCKCVGCRNIEDCLERKRSWAEELDGPHKKFASNEEDGWGVLGRDLSKNYKWPVNYITPDVIEATCQCLLAQADEAVKNDSKEEKVIDEILEEFGRCLVQIIECFNKTTATREDTT